MLGTIPLPSFPKAKAGGMTSFLFSPEHISPNPLSQPVSDSLIPSVNQTGWPSLLE